MQRDNIAEFLLGLVTDPETATPAIGDLSEDAATRGNLWFWSGVLQTFFSPVRRDLAAFPLRMPGLALWAWMALNVLNILIVASATTVTFMISRAGQAAARMPSGDPSALAWPRWAAAALAIIAVAALIGWLLARRSRGREFGVIIATTFLFAVLAGSASFAAWILPMSGIGTHIGRNLLIPPVWPLWVIRITSGALVPVLVGWLLARRSAGRELAAAIAATAVSAVQWWLIYCFISPKRATTSPLEFVSGFLFLLIGSVLFRRSYAGHPGGLHAT